MTHNTTPKASDTNSTSTYGTHMQTETPESNGCLKSASKGLLWFVGMTSIAFFSFVQKDDIFLAIGTLAVLGAINEIMMTISFLAASSNAPWWLKSLHELQGTFAQK